MSWTKIGARITLGAAAVLLAAYLLYLVRAVVLILLVSIIFAQAISPLVLRLRRIGARRSQAVLAIYLLIVLALAALIWFLAQAVASELGSLLSALPEMQTQLKDLAAHLPSPYLRDSAQQLLATGVTPPPAATAAAVSGKVLGTVLAIAEAIFAVFTIFVVTFYWISERLAIRQIFLRALPSEHREQGLHIWDDVEDKLGAWVRGELLLMAAIGLAFAIGLTAMGVKFGLLLAVFAGVAELIPLVGPYIGTAPAVLVALTQSPQLALFVALYGVAVQLLENNVLVPRIMGHSTGISPLTVILGILVGATIAGIPGAFLAVPVAAAAQVLLVDLEVLGSGELTEPVLPVNHEEAEEPPPVPAA